MGLDIPMTIYQPTFDVGWLYRFELVRQCLPMNDRKSGT